MQRGYALQRASGKLRRWREAQTWTATTTARWPPIPATAAGVNISKCTCNYKDGLLYEENGVPSTQVAFPSCYLYFNEQQYDNMTIVAALMCAADAIVLLIVFRGEQRVSAGNRHRVSRSQRCTSCGSTGDSLATCRRLPSF